MKGKDVVKTGFGLIIDLIIFGLLAFLVGLAIGNVLFYIFKFDIVFYRNSVSVIGIIVFIILMYWNFKYRYKKSSIAETESNSEEE